MDEEELKAAVDQFLIDYNTPLHSSWGLREYLFRFADTLLAAQRERAITAIMLAGVSSRLVAEALFDQAPMRDD